MEVKSFKKGTSFSDCHKGATWASCAIESLHEQDTLLNIVLTFQASRQSLEVDNF